MRLPAALPTSCSHREVKVMAGLGKHPNVVGVLAACLEPPLAVVQV